MDVRTYVRTDVWTDIQTDVPTDERTDVRMDVRMDVRTDVRKLPPESYSLHRLFRSLRQIDGNSPLWFCCPIRKKTHFGNLKCAQQGKGYC